MKNLNAEDLADELRSRNPELNDSIAVATTLHDGQTRRAPRRGQRRLPYIEHPLRVATRLARLGANDHDLLTSAVLHDVVEDCSDKIATSPAGAVEALSGKFGHTVAATVSSLSVPRGANYAEHVSVAVAADPRALLVKVSDWIDNAGSLHHMEEVPARLVSKYSPMTEVLLNALTAAYNETDHLLQGNSEKLQEKVVRVGARLVDLSQPPSPDR